LRVTVIATGLSSVARRSQTPLTVVQAPVAQQAAGLRTGTDNMPVLNQQVGQPDGAPVARTDYAGLNTPSVWRSARTKVEALANNGMDEIEIPAFLRRQAD
jgi:cell division protein FtsZ